jgi:hypothetical protein
MSLPRPERWVSPRPTAQEARLFPSGTSTLTCASAPAMWWATTNAGSCATGTNQVTQPMMHVWLAPVPGGPLAPDPPGGTALAAANQLPAPNPPNGTA